WPTSLRRAPACCAFCYCHLFIVRSVPFIHDWTSSPWSLNFSYPFLYIYIYSFIFLFFCFFAVVPAAHH
ncbi:hypothetical protein LIPSTDRAFT_95633, partial [Lipomyces starkeyi NRRL Y-11557]